jgi:hypothetical protein
VALGFFGRFWACKPKLLIRTVNILLGGEHKMMHNPVVCDDSNRIDTADILNAIADDSSLILFNTIAITDRTSSDILISKLKLTRKQYYSRLFRLIKNGLVKRKNGKYFLTSFGKIVYGAQLLIEKAVEQYWALKAIDSLEMSNNNILTEERNKIISILLERNPQIIEILVR